MNRSTIQSLFIRVCRDSGFMIECTNAATLVANIAKIHPLQVWEAMDMSIMEQIAAGLHPACNRRESQ